MRYYNKLVAPNDLQQAISELERSIKNTRFSRLLRICEEAFGAPRRSRGGGSHIRFKTPWPGDPRINLQNVKGKAKPYQVRQVIASLTRLLADASSDGGEDE